MKIGYCVEGATDRAFLVGLKERWCPSAALVEGRFRGSTGLRLRAEIPQICRELDWRGCQAMVFLTDANKRPWREVGASQRERVPPEFAHRTVSAVADRNVECWLCADRDWIAGKTGRPASEFDGVDPKGVFELALGISRRNRNEAEISSLVREAPLGNWIARSPSFEDLYEKARRMRRSVECSIPNERG